MYSANPVSPHSSTRHYNVAVQRIVALAGEEIVEQILQVSCKEPSAF